MGYIQVSYVAMLFWLTLAAVPGASAQDTGELWSVDFAHSRSAQQTPPFQRPLKLLFVDNNTLLLAYDCAARPGQPPTAGVLIDIQDGKIHAPTSWYAVYPVLHATASGKLLIYTGGSENQGNGTYKGPGSWLYLRAPDDLDLWSARGRQPMNLGDTRADKISPDGRTLAMYRARLAPYPPDVIFLNAESLLDTGKRFSGLVSGISNDGIVSVDSKGVVSIQDGNGNRELYRSDCPEVVPQFLDDRHVLVTACQRFVVLDLNGKPLYEESYSAKSATTWSEVRFADVARNANRFALTVSTKESADPPSVVAQRLMVYEIPSGKHVFTVNSVGWCWAISPDGSLLAQVTYDGIIRLFRVRPA